MYYHNDKAAVWCLTDGCNDKSYVRRLTLQKHKSLNSPPPFFSFVSSFFSLLFFLLDKFLIFFLFFWDFFKAVTSFLFFSLSRAIVVVDNVDVCWSL